MNRAWELVPCKIVTKRQHFVNRFLTFRRYPNGIGVRDRRRQNATGVIYWQQMQEVP